MTPYLSDHSRIELALIPALLRRTFGAVVEQDERHADTLELIKQAMTEPLTGLDARRQTQLTRRLDAMQTEIMMPYERTSVMQCLMMAFMLVKELSDNGTLELVDGSPFDQAIEAIAEALGEHADLWQAVQPSAQKHATKILRQLRHQGYYRQTEGIAA